MEDTRPIHWLDTAVKQRMDVSPSGVRTTKVETEVTCEVCIIDIGMQNDHA